MDVAVDAWSYNDLYFIMENIVGMKYRRPIVPVELLVSLKWLNRGLYDIGI